MEQDLPKISIVTPAYNSERFIEKTIQSILGQDYPNLEYIIIDGASKDGTVDIIKQYAEHLSYWHSEADSGMYHAIQKGFEQSTGEIMAWLNSDDLYFPWTLATVAEIFQDLPEVEWISSTRIIVADEKGHPKQSLAVTGYSQSGFFHREHAPLPKQTVRQEYVQQESTFWRRSLWEKAGSRMDLNFKYAGDAELWLRLTQHAQLYGVQLPLAAFRQHGDQITTNSLDGYHDEVEKAYQLYGIGKQSAYYKFLRRHVARLFHPRIRKIGAWMGALHPTYQCSYNTYQKKWSIKKNYY